MNIKRIKSLFMGMCASLVMLALVSFFNSELKPYFDHYVAVNSLVTPTPTVTPVPTSEEVKNSTASGELSRVKKVIDGDTIELENGQKLRYIGIDSPESKKPNTPVQCFAEAAYVRNKELVEGKEVRLVKDVSDKDRFQRLLRYVYVDDVLVNQVLVEEGYAFARSYPPDIALQDYLREAQARARASNKGLWQSCSVIPKGTKGEMIIQ